jgi:hypothetical protein
MPRSKRAIQSVRLSLRATERCFESPLGPTAILARQSPQPHASFVYDKRRVKGYLGVKLVALPGRSELGTSSLTRALAEYGYQPIGEKTVKTQVSNIIAKLAVQSRNRSALMAVERSLASLELGALAS